MGLDFFSENFSPFVGAGADSNWVFPAAEDAVPSVFQSTSVTAATNASGTAKLGISICQ